MDWQYSDNDAHNGDAAATPGTKVAVICDDFEATARAIRVLADLGDLWRFWLDPVVWHLGDLNTTANQHTATDDLVEADFVIIAFNRPHLVPEPVLQWLEMCVFAKHVWSSTEIVHASGGPGWKIAFYDVHGTLTSQPEIPMLFRHPKKGAGARRRPRAFRGRKSGERS